MKLPPRQPLPYPLRRYVAQLTDSIAHAGLSVALALIELALATALAALILIALAYLAVRWVVCGCAAWARAVWSATVAVMGS